MLTSKGQATRDRIVVAASTLMHANGVAGTSLDDVRAAAGVSMSQIYHYFADKRALTRAVIEHQCTVVLGVQEQLLCQLDSMDALRAWGDFVVEVQRAQGCTRGCPLGSLAGELADSDDHARADLAAGYLRWQQIIRDGLAGMRERGELRADTDVDALATALLTTVQGGILLTKTMRDTGALQTALNTVFDHIGSYALAQQDSR